MAGKLLSILTVSAQGMEYKMHTFLVYNLSEQHLIDNTQCSPSPLFMKNSLDGTKSFICYILEPDYINNITTKQGPFDYSEMMVVLEGSEWKINN